MKRKIAGAILMVMVFAGAAAAGGYQGGDCRRERTPLTQEQKVQRDAMRKLKTELRAELSKEKPDQAKARQLFKKELAMKQKFRAERFEACLNNGVGCKWERDGRKGRGAERFATECPAWKELRAEMSKSNPDKAKARVLYKDVEKFRETKETERFEKVLKDPSKYMNGKKRTDGKGGYQSCGKTDCQGRTADCGGTRQR